MGGRCGGVRVELQAGRVGLCRIRASIAITGHHASCGQDGVPAACRARAGLEQSKARDSKGVGANKALWAVGCSLCRKGSVVRAAGGRRGCALRRLLSERDGVDNGKYSSRKRVKSQLCC